MTEDFKKWLCRLAGITDYDVEYKCIPKRKQCPTELTECRNCGFAKEEIIITLNILIRAMWELDSLYCKNEIDYHIKEYCIEHGYQIVYGGKHDGKLKPSDVNFITYDVHNIQSRIKALRAALEYIFKKLI